jgi:hypothetical protein
MSIQILSHSTPKARKAHRCMASEFILAAGISGFGYSFSELRAIAKAKKNNYRVVKGQRYIKQNNKLDGELYTFKAIPQMHQICLAHDHYEY